MLVISYVEKKGRNIPFRPLKEFDYCCCIA